MKLYQIMGLSIVGVIGLGYVSTLIGVSTIPARVVNDSISTQNIISNYENFYNIKSGYDSRVSQINRMSKNLDNDKYSRIDMAGVQQKCVELALEYNSKSEMINRNFTKADDLPSSLDVNSCEIEMKDTK